jgi:RNA recognition motif. (a.k.a. RRM, RBD, or RNP domain)
VIRRLPPLAAARRIFGILEDAEDDDDDDDRPGSTTKKKTQKQEKAEAEELLFAQYFPDGVRPGAEMDVRIVRVHRDYALCRPVDFPHLRGKISKNEMRETMSSSYYDADDNEIDATEYSPVKVGTILRAQVKHQEPPDRLELSLRRVRRVLIDEFQPFTIAIFGLPDLHDNYDDQEEVEYQLELLMRESGPVEEVDFISSASKRKEPIAFVTFLHKEHALAAMRKWNRTRMRFTVNVEGDDDEDDDEDDKAHVQPSSSNGTETDDDDDEHHLYYRVRCQKANRQSYRDLLQDFLDARLADKIERWDEPYSVRRCRERAEEMLAEQLPWYPIDKKYNEDYWEDTMAETRSTAYQYSVKNEPGRGLQLISRRTTNTGTGNMMIPPPSNARTVRNFTES